MMEKQLFHGGEIDYYSLKRIYISENCVEYWIPVNNTHKIRILPNEDLTNQYNKLESLERNILELALAKDKNFITNTIYAFVEALLRCLTIRKTNEAIGNFESALDDEKLRINLFNMQDYGAVVHISTLFEQQIQELFIHIGAKLSCDEHKEKFVVLAANHFVFKPENETIHLEFIIVFLTVTCGISSMMYNKLEDKTRMHKFAKAITREFCNCIELSNRSGGFVKNTGGWTEFRELSCKYMQMSKENDIEYNFFKTCMDSLVHYIYKYL